MILAIVGSVRFLHPDAPLLARQIICHKLEIYEPELVVSGGAEGIDSVAALCARGMEIEVREFLPEHPRWAPNGYEDRNKLIAEACTNLLAIRCHQSRTYGSGWTADYAQKLGKRVERIIL